MNIPDTFWVCKLTMLHSSKNTSAALSSSCSFLNINNILPFVTEATTDGSCEADMEEIQKILEKKM